MILSCNSCGKKFVVPDQAINENGRLVQCGSCGNKWKQFPISSKINIVSSIKKKTVKKKQIDAIVSKPKKKKQRKTREIDLYSPEYLAKKHGITIKDINEKKPINEERISFGFYNSLILFIVILIAFSKGLHFSQDFLIQKFPYLEFYLDYFFENIRNMFEIWKNLISNY
tara:strand:+ start:139 stop:648 length:510 start_codon:yes stop_codon:yes gene_type:complete